MSNIIPFDRDNIQLPAHLKGGKSDDLMETFASGLEPTGFPVLSIRGSKWRLKRAGEETPLLDRNKNPIPAIALVILGANTGLAKTYYAKAYAEGDDAAPDCWSLDGDTPDASVEKPQAKSCQQCKWNVWGSKITPQGTKTKMCSDAKRLAVITAPDLTREEPKVGPMLLRVPPASLSKGEGSLRSLMLQIRDMNAKLLGVVVRVTFDVESDYPKIHFAIAGFIDDEEVYARAKKLADSDVVANITQSMGEASGNEPSDETEEEAAAPEQDERGQAEETDFLNDDDGLGGGEEKEASPPKTVRKKRTTKKRAAKKAAAKKAAEPAEETPSGGNGAADTGDFEGALDDLQGFFDE